MGLLNDILGMFGLGSGKPNMGKLDPDDIRTFTRVKSEIDDAERSDDDAVLGAALAKYGLKSTDQLSDIDTYMMTRHRLNPEILFAVAVHSHEEGIAQCATSGHPIAEQYLAPVEGVPLHRFALLQATMEAEGAAGLARYDVDEAAFGRISAEWHSRMSSTDGAFTTNILSGSYHTFYLLAQDWVSKGHCLFKA